MAAEPGTTWLGHPRSSRRWGRRGVLAGMAGPRCRSSSNRLARQCRGGALGECPRVRRSVSADDAWVQLGEAFLSLVREVGVWRGCRACLVQAGCLVLGEVPARGAQVFA